ncbi:tyrosine-type recombinase/integrase [Dactylosporangium sp. NPDC000244]|uniref:tyrosine-type recombinase/integrase n=1 Tax=Dactylosporangium sp. NPDC000244 TaxID=3154365 RepID=UPI003331098E
MTAAANPELEAARLLLAKLGVSPEDLLQPASARTATPTFREYLPVVRAAVGPGTLRAYGSYWNRIEQQWGDRRMDEVKPTEISGLVELVKAGRVMRRNGRSGRGTAENLIAALRCVYNRAVDDGYLRKDDNPALKVAKPRRLPSTRGALADAKLAELNAAAASSGNDPELDALLLRLHTETACRRGGALALRPVDLDEGQCLVRLREKGETVRWQPVSPTLMRYLLQHACERGAAAEGQLLRYRNGTPVTRRRYDHLFVRLGRLLPWVATQQVSIHWLRHTTLTWVERNFGYAIAQAYAGHADSTGEVGTTARYVRAKLSEVAAALAALTAEPHPMQ